MTGEGLKEIKKGAFSKQSDCRANQIKFLPVRNGGVFFFFFFSYIENIFNRILGVSVDSILFRKELNRYFRKRIFSQETF